MALKADRDIYMERIDCVTPTGLAIAQGSVLVSPVPQPSGHAVGQGINLESPTAVPTDSGGPPSGVRVLGILMDAVVAPGDLTTYHRNFQRVTQLAGENVDLLKDGWVWTDNYNGTPAANAPAFVGPNSKWQATQVNGVPAAGVFETSPGPDGYVKVTIKVA